MRLSKKQKQACKLISEEKVFDAFSFMINIYPELFTCVQKNIREEQGNPSYQLRKVDIEYKEYCKINISDDNFVFMYSNEIEIRKALTEFLSLINTLESEHLIIRTRKMVGLANPARWLVPISNKIDTDQCFHYHSHQCNQILMDDFFFHSDYHFYSLSELKIIPTLHLNEFISSKYVTSSEKTNIITFTIGLIGIAIAITSSIYSIQQTIKSNRDDTLQYNKTKTDITDHLSIIEQKLEEREKNAQIHDGVINNIKLILDETSHYIINEKK
jgi:hypothetical protein